ncbi:MAG: TetR/AcrR family transcriptional regulator [Leucobacter sp.]
MTDARILRTRAALHKAITELATQKPVGEITVSELAESAGINRVTFYKHYTTPAEALADALHTELKEIVAAAAPAPEIDAFTHCIYTALDHLEERRELYTIAFSDQVDGTIPIMLSRFLTDVAETYLTKRRKRKPAVPDVDLDVAAAFLANGATGAIRVWILEGDMSRERFFENLPLLLPAWFQAEAAAN